MTDPGAKPGLDFVNLMLYSTFSPDIALSTLLDRRRLRSNAILDGHLHTLYGIIGVKVRATKPLMLLENAVAHLDNLSRSVKLSQDALVLITTVNL